MLKISKESKCKVYSQNTPKLTQIFADLQSRKLVENLVFNFFRVLCIILMEIRTNWNSIQ